LRSRNRQLTADTAPQARRHRGDYMLILFMGVLMLLGLIVIYSISPALTAQINASGSNLDQNHFMYRQLVYLTAGIVAFVVASNVPLEWWRRYHGQLLIAALGLCMVPIIFARTSLALCADGACRWINLGFVTIQPVEMVKLALVLFLAAFLAKKIQDGTVNNWQEALKPIGLVLLVVAAIVVWLQRDLGTGVAIFAIAVFMLYVGGLKAKYFLAVLAVVAGGGLLFIATSSYRLARVATFLNPANDSTGTGYHINQALIAVGSGGLVGKGIGQSVQAFGYLPEAANDSIFAIVAEKFGFIGTVAILLIFAALLLRLIKIMDNVNNNYYRLLLAGVFGWVFTHTVVNIGAMLGIFPLTGVTLPFLSFGGTSLLFIMMALGIAFQISHYTTHQLEQAEKAGGMTYENRRSGRRLGRTRHASTGRYS